MKSSSLHLIWSSPDNSRTTARQYSFRLPVHVAAKISALCDMYPNKTRTEIVGDLLSTSIDEAIQGMPVYEGDVIDVLPDGEEIKVTYGPRIDFWEIANKYYQELERELGNENPPSISEALKFPSRKDEE